MYMFNIVGYLFWVIIIVVAIYLFRSRSKGPKGKASILMPKISPLGKTSEQKKVIKYFVGTGCLAAFSKISDKEFDNILYRKVSSYDIQQMALERLGLETDQIKAIDPILLDGYVTTSALSCLGADMVPRYSEYSLTCLLFSDAQLYRYTFIFSLIDDSTLEYTDEYFYADVTALSVSKDNNVKYYKKGCLGSDANIVKFVTPAFKLVVPGDSFNCVMREENEPSVFAMMAKLREKKLQ